MFEISRVDIVGRPDWAKRPEWLSKHMDENLVLQDVDDAGNLSEIQKLFKDRKMAAMRSTFRSKMDDFVTRTGAKPAGCSHVNVQGQYLLGDVPKKDVHYLDDRAQRCRMQDAYADAIAFGVNKANQDIGFVPSADARYPTKELAKRAIEMESLSSKGCYDNGDNRLAFQVEEDNLTDALTDLVMDDVTMSSFFAGLERRRMLYAASPGINKSRKFAVGTYAETNARRGTRDTLRGGFNCSGDTLIEFWMISLLQWDFAHLTNLAIHTITTEKVMIDKLRKRDKIVLPPSSAKGRSDALRKWIIDKYTGWQDRPSFKVLNAKKISSDGFVDIDRSFTIDELIDWLNVDIFDVKGYNVAEAYSWKLGLMGNLQRDQGSPYVYEFDGVKYKVVGRKKRKYRMVEPVHCVAQSWLMAAGEEIVDVAPTLPGRVGMQHPKVNRAKMSKYALETFEVGCFNLNVDLTRFDAGHIDQQCTATGLMYASLYDDVNSKMALSMLGLFCMDKYMIMAKPVNNPGQIWSYYHHVEIPAIKGSASDLITRAALHSKDGRLRKEAEAQLERINEEDFIAVCVHVRRSWTPSGIFFTNTFESDMNLAVHTDVVPRWLINHDEIAIHKDIVEELKVAIRDGNIQAQASGDDITYRVLISLLKQFGLARLTEIMSEAYKTINWTLNWKKMSLVSYPITYKGETIYVTPIEFLQWLYFQDPETPDLEPRRKFCRALPSFPYTERDSSLPLVMQWSSFDGRLNTCLTNNKEDLEFASKVVVYAGERLYKLYHQQRLRPKRSKGVRDYIRNGDKIMYDARFEGGKSKLLCLDQWLGFVKQYGDRFIPELNGYVMDRYPGKVVQLVNTYQRELETRAPHKRGMLQNILEGFTDEEKSLFFGEVDVTAFEKVESIDAEFLRAIEERGITIEPISFPSPGMDGEVESSSVE